MVSDNPAHCVALVIVVKLDVFEDLASGLGPVVENLVVWKTLCFQRAEECPIVAFS
jgi:hypothetical protein